MQHSVKFPIVLSAMFALAACDDTTNSLGIFPETDAISNSIAIYQASTRSVLLDSVVANSNSNYLGHIIDPETDNEIVAEFAAQFATLEEYALPERNLMVGTVDGEEKRGVVQCDSAEVRLYFESYYGEGNNPMKLMVYEMSRDNMLSEDSIYYTDVDLSRFSTNRLLASRVFTPMDYNLSETDLTSSSHSHNVRMMLGEDFGQNILDKYYENKQNFQDSYHFTHNVFPGLHFTTSAGLGTMLNVYVGTVNVYFRYADAQKDTVYTGVARFAATPEVIQSTRFKNDRTRLQQLIEDPANANCTFLKTPAGICTEMTLPIDNIFSGAHATDSVSLASITLTRYNKEQGSYQLGTPEQLLMVRKQDGRAFFAENRVSDGRTSYTAAFNSVYNTYTYSNIGRLVSYCKHEKIEAVRQSLKSKGIENFTAEQFAAEEKTWMEAHPDWNKVLLIPVVTTTLEQNSVSVETSVNHDLGLRSIRLVGGDTKIDLQVIYSKFYQDSVK